MVKHLKELALLLVLSRYHLSLDSLQVLKTTVEWNDGFSVGGLFLELILNLLLPLLGYLEVLHDSVVSLVLDQVL